MKPQYGGNLFTAFLISSVIGIILGLISGLLIHFLQIPPIITTIAGCFRDSNLGSNPSGRNDAESFSSGPSLAAG
jgi:ribose/xylose/arabinose/galactoside ABC-type transport system permease subunit